MSDMKAKESYLVSKSFKSFLVATVLSSIITQVNVMVDGVIVGNCISPDAVSVLNLVVPISNTIFGITSLLCAGASILAAKALGSQDYNHANKIFTIATLSVFVFISLISVMGIIFLKDIISLLCPIRSLYAYLNSYLSIMIPGYVVSSLFTCFTGFVSVDGQPAIIAKAVIGDAVTNFICDILFIYIFGWGIAGSAWAAILGFTAGLIILGFFMLSKHFSFRFVLDHNFMGIMKANMKEGTPIMVWATIMAIMFFAANSIVIQVQGAQGIFVMSVCIQLLMFGLVAFTSINQTIFSIGGLMIGENDMHGLRILVRDCMLFLNAVLILFSAYVIIAPQSVARLFGCDNPLWLSSCGTPIRIFSLCLIPLGIIIMIKSLYQILGHFNASIIFGLLPTSVVIPSMWLISGYAPSLIWSAFPLSFIFVVLLIWVYSELVRKKHPDYQRFTLIPADDKKYSMRQTVMYTNEDVDRVLKEIKSFLEASMINDTLTNHAVICCEELMYNIVQHATNQPDKHFFDVHALVNDEKFTIIIKDDGKQFNPKFPYVEPTEEQLFGGEDLKLGLTLVNGLCDDINYKYMYGQNMLYLNFKR
jgi:Na+-driven multidrug efflux pump/anti-sigma regulatory factor (Ser/Thr protein kinase)